MARPDGRAWDQLRPISVTRDFLDASGRLGAGGVRGHQGHLHGYGRGQGSALPQGAGARVGDRRVRHAAALDEHAQPAREPRAERAVAGDPAPGWTGAARRGRAEQARRAHDLDRLRRDPGRRRHAHGRHHRRLHRAGRRGGPPAGRRRRPPPFAIAWPPSASGSSKASRPWT